MKDPSYLLLIKLVGAWCSDFGRAYWCVSFGPVFQCRAYYRFLLLFFHLRVESWFICFLFWCFGESEVLRADRITHNWATTRQNQQNECVPSKDSDQPGHPPSLIRVFTVRMKKAWTLSYPLSGQRRLWSDWADSQAHLSLRWAHTHFVGFVMSRLICLCTTGEPRARVARA